MTRLPFINADNWLSSSTLALTSCMHAAAAKSLQSCPTLCDPIDSSPPGSPIHGIFQARVLKWVAIAFSDFMHDSSVYSVLPYKTFQHFFQAHKIKINLMGIFMTRIKIKIQSVRSHHHLNYILKSTQCLKSFHVRT